MLEKLKANLAAHWDVVSYLFFGGLTTLINWAVFFPAYNFLGFGKVAAQVVAWIVAVAFAYLTNRRWVFHSGKRGFLPVAKEAAAFTGGRLASFGVETGLLLLGTDLLRFPVNIVKIVVTIITVILNYVFSKWFVFRKSRGAEQS